MHWMHFELGLGGQLISKQTIQTKMNDKSAVTIAKSIDASGPKLSI